MRSNAPQLSIEQVDIQLITNSPHHARKHSPKQIEKLAKSIDTFGFVGAVLIDDGCQLLAGHALVEAAKRLGMKAVPAIRVRHLDDAQKRAFAVALNRLAELATWDEEKLRIEVKFLSGLDIDFDFTAIGFETPEIDVILDAGTEDAEDTLPAVDEVGQASVAQTGDLWILGQHRLYCGDALDKAAYEAVLGPDRARATITDPPYNVRVDGHVRVAGSPHREFAMACGEMSSEAFVEFLTKVAHLIVGACVDGSLHYLFMDWRHIGELLCAGKKAFSEVKNLVVWNKMSGGMGSFYRSQHELIVVFKAGTAPHVNNIELGVHGRYRTNVWDHPGANAFGRGKDALLAVHPTVKPVALIADAIKDCSNHGDLILDPFAGSGTILIAAEKTRRRTAAIEIDPLYVDAGIRRWQAYTGKPAVHAATGMTFTERAEYMKAAMPADTVPVTDTDNLEALS